jgi:hypothetical protein
MQSRRHESHGERRSVDRRRKLGDRINQVQDSKDELVNLHVNMQNLKGHQGVPLYSQSLLLVHVDIQVFHLPNSQQRP